MSDFISKLESEIKNSSSKTLLAEYLSDKKFEDKKRELRSGRHFETFMSSQNEPFKITPSDLLAITQLSMRIGGNNIRTSIRDSAVIDMFEGPFQDEMSNYLKQIPTDLRMEKINSAEFEKFINVSRNIWKLLDKIGFKEVAKYKLMSRKRPHLCPIRDSFVEKALGRRKDWYTSWYSALQSEFGVVGELEELQRNCSAARHLSLLRVADIIIWERQKQKSENRD